jgi:dGTPase
MGKSDPLNLQQLKETLNSREDNLFSSLAAFSSDAVRRVPEARIHRGHRQNYAVDSDRILHSLAYARYIDKTQVFYLVVNDHITHRVLHVQLVSKISRTIGRFLGLNEDLVEAIALGHDIGHCPFGHDGEAYLSELCEDSGIGPYQHNVQSVRFLDRIERKGRGLNLTLQVLDGILCHDGEIHAQALEPNHHKRFTVHDEEVVNKTADPGLALTPMTMEGCVVRMADTISYIGRDIEDAIRLNLINRTQLPKSSEACLGNTNGTIVYALVTDLITNSLHKPAIAFSTEVSDALKELRQFNLANIYLNPKIKPQAGRIRQLFQLLFERYTKDLKQGNESSIIFAEYLDDMSEDYRANTRNSEIARDFIAGMTDDFFLSQVPQNLRPARLTGRF